MRRSALLRAAVLLAVIGPAGAQTVTTAVGTPSAMLDIAAHNFPSIIMGIDVQAVPARSPQPLSCPISGARVDQAGGPPMEYLGSVPGQPDLCHMHIGGDEMDLWYGLWGVAWPGGDQARRAIQLAMNGPTGEIHGFDTIAAPGVQWHDFVRQEGVERILILGKTYRAMKLAHYREGFGGNVYRSVSTVWKDMDTGLLIYGTYQHISGAPQLDGALTPSAIVPAH